MTWSENRLWCWQMQTTKPAVSSPSVTNYWAKTQTTIVMTGESARMVEGTMWLSSCSISRQIQKSLSERNVWVGWMSVFVSEFVFGKVRWKKGEKGKEERGIGREGKSPMPESCYSENGISPVSRLTSPCRRDRSCQIQDILKSCGYWC